MSNTVTVSFITAVNIEMVLCIELKKEIERVKNKELLAQNLIDQINDENKKDPNRPTPGDFFGAQFFEDI